MLTRLRKLTELRKLTDLPLAHRWIPLPPTVTMIAFGGRDVWKSNIETTDRES